LDFMRLAAGSDLINAGVNVGLPFNGAAPDLGAFESVPEPPAVSLAAVFFAIAIWVNRTGSRKRQF
jgi:hypothetical protein